MKSDEKTISALTAQAHNAEADKRTLQRKLAASERRAQELENRLAEQQAASDEQIRILTDKLSQEVGKVSSMMQQLVSYMMGKGDVTLAGTLHETIVAGIREEVRQEFRAMLDEKDALLREKDARIAALEAMQNHDDNSLGSESPEITSGNFHSDESTLQVLDVPVDTKEGDEVPMHYYIRWIYDFIAPGSGLTQYWFYGQGRRTQKAVEEYVKGITGKTYIHTDGAKMYEIYNAAGIIMRVACAVHVRRPFWKLKATSDDACRIVYLFDEVFRKEREWNEEKGMTVEERRRRRWEEVYPILHEMKNILDRMEKELDKETEPDLVRAVTFALKEYPQLLRYLDDGRLAFSNNVCELQMRQIAIYRNQSYFLGSVKSAKRFARLVSLTQSAKNCKCNVQKYFHDILNRVVVTVKDELVSILPHKWVEPVTIPLFY